MKNPSHTCVDCKGAYRTLQQDNVRLTAENSRLAGENQSLRSRLQNLETQFANFKHDIKNEILSEINNTAGSSISREALRKEISSVILEQREQEKRQLNLFIRNYPETAPDTDEIASIRSFISTKLGIESEELNAGILSYRRLGTRGENARACIITCASNDVRRKILRDAKKLKDFRTPENKNVFISPDLTKMQLEVDKKLKEELWRRRNNNENVTIRRGKIINLSTPVRNLGDQ